MCGGSELKAASGDGKKSRATRKIDAMFALSCCHSILLKALPFTGGELAVYPCALYLLAGVRRPCSAATQCAGASSAETCSLRSKMSLSPTASRTLRR